MIYSNDKTNRNNKDNIHMLTHHPLDKIAAVSQTIFSDAFSWVKKKCILIKISLKFIPKGPIDNNPALV